MGRVSYISEIDRMSKISCACDNCGNDTESYVMVSFDSFNDEVSSIHQDSFCLKCNTLSKTYESDRTYGNPETEIVYESDEDKHDEFNYAKDSAYIEYELSEGKPYVPD